MVGTLLAAAALAQSPQPSVVMSSMLETRFFFQNAEPAIAPTNVQVAFAPTGQHEAKLVYSKGDEVLVEVPMRSEPRRAGVFAEYSPRTSAGQPLGLGDGPRSVEFQIDGATIGRMDFTLTGQDSGDPFDPKTEWTVRGPWGELAYLFHTTDTGFRQDVLAVFWVAKSETTGDDPVVNLVMRRGNTVLAQGDDRRPSAQGYQRFEQPLTKPDGDPLTVPDLASIAGPFVVEVKQGDRVLRSWRGAIADGKLVENPRSAATGVPPVEFLSPRQMVSGGGMSDRLLTWLSPPPQED